MTQQTTASGDEWLLDTPVLRQFIETVNQVRGQEADPRRIVAAVRPHFASLLADSTWLPAHFQETAEESGMGRGIGMWLPLGMARRKLSRKTGTSSTSGNALARW